MNQRLRSLLPASSCLFGLLSLLGVMCFHFPRELTSAEFRSAYSVDFARDLLLFGLVASFVLGTLAVLLDRGRRAALVGVGAASVAVLLGGSDVAVEPFAPTRYSLGVDWFVLALFFSAVVFIPLERHLGVRQIDVARTGWRTDLTYFFVSHVLVQFILIAVTVLTAPVARAVSLPGVQAFVAGLPFWVQFLAAAFVADLAQAVLHRAYHRVSALWRFHAVHHSSRDMDWLAGSRVHLVETVLTRSIVLLPLLVLGFSVPAVNAYVILVGLQAVVAHANLGIRFGWLEYLVVLPRYHHWHHARHIDYWDRNYAIHFPVVDMLMGSFKLPRDGSWPEEYGVLKLETVPQGIVAQTLMPFRGDREYVDHVA
ncbi:sterol desaturase family protein [Nocardioides acrostichi]|uniref:Sterol desaturase family protein n=1 Tax=Nocardioides acrostichi TaxID=2784339 RepID=A0A930UY85_9ACTN|nr:sterol desaturase family protein [Nocardioides acrostichi]MBF4161260.1 sterol desaturase family protein [Nocardioides acrostichi]